MGLDTAAAAAAARSTPSITFVSPPVEEAKVTDGCRVSKFVVYLLQSTGQMLQLEYANETEAGEAVDDLTAASSSHFVPTIELFDAIRKSLKTADHN